jgi:hypothetical protein
MTNIIAVIVPKPKPTKEERKLRKGLEELVKAVTIHLAGLDFEMKGPSTEERGKRIAKLATALEYAKDSARFFVLGIDYRTGKPRKAPAARKAGGTP